ncbi:MAG: DMT family transporter [Bacteroidetes bacterium]|jgi:drug/metabolite transporter (DMT)-like permease|nr:DMT family transporter [Bacteroidota bacterium]
MNPRSEKQVLIGISLATLAALIWSGNFIVARAAYKLLPPVSMAFFRWLTATIIILPFGLRALRAEKRILLENKKYLFYCALTGITLFNTCIYIAGHYTTAINLALVGTSSSPIMAVVLASIFLKERVTPLRILGLSLCVFGILYLMGKGDLRHILLLKFSLGDLWVLLGAFFFAIYNVLARKKPSGISPLTFLTYIFSLGTLMLLPFFILEQKHSPAIQWNLHLFWIVLYLGLGNSVISYLCWNAAIARLGAARTALFGNLIPIFASIEAAYLLNESITIVHVISLVLVIIGLIIANIRNRKP